MKKRESIKIGNTSFDVESIKNMSWKKFEETYSKIAVDFDLKKAFLECGGKIKS